MCVCVVQPILFKSNQSNKINEIKNLTKLIQISALFFSIVRLILFRLLKKEYFVHFCLIFLL